MKGRPKPYRMRKPYKMKGRGGGKFMLAGKTKYTRPMSTGTKTKTDERSMVKVILQKMGFRVGNR